MTSSDPLDDATAYPSRDDALREDAVARLLDANANRAREAVRTIEDAARFVLDDDELARAAKDLRHAVAAAVAAFARAGIDGLAARDVAGDVGTTITVDAETRRAGVAGVARAAAGRLTEALRVLEEYGKLVDAGAAATLERARYDAYALERTLVLRLRGAAPAAPQWRLCVLVTASLCRGDWRAVAEAAVDGGADCLQLREKDLADRELLRRCRTLLEIAGDRAAVVMNDRADVAAAAGADGVHLGQGDLDVADVRRAVRGGAGRDGRRLLVGVSTFDEADAVRAAAAGADLCGVGPMFATTTKHKDAIAGPERLAAFVAWARRDASASGRPALPHLAIGGITPRNVGQVVAAGGRGVAASAAVCAAEDPRAAAAQLRAAVDAGHAGDAAAKSHESSHAAGARVPAVDRR